MYHVDFGVMDGCINLQESYGEICVRCNACGRFNKETQKEAQLKLYERQLQDQYNFEGWDDDFKEIQQKNINFNIESLKKKIADLKKDLGIEKNPR